MPRVKEMTREQLENALTWWRQMGLDVWNQYAQYSDMKGKVRYSNMCLSTLEDLEESLYALGMIDKKGFPIQGDKK